MPSFGDDATVALAPKPGRATDTVSLPSVPHGGGRLPSSPGAGEKIREKLTAGMLPTLRDAGGITFVGSGAGQICDGCDTAILPAEMEYSVAARDHRTFRFHVRCVLLWQMYARPRGG